MDMVYMLNAKDWKDGQPLSLNTVQASCQWGGGGACTVLSCIIKIEYHAVGDTLLFYGKWCTELKIGSFIY